MLEYRGIAFLSASWLSVHERERESGEEGKRGC